MSDEKLDRPVANFRVTKSLLDRVAALGNRLSVSQHSVMRSALSLGLEAMERTQAVTADLAVVQSLAPPTTLQPVQPTGGS